MQTITLKPGDTLQRTFANYPLPTGSAWTLRVQARRADGVKLADATCSFVETGVGTGLWNGTFEFTSIQTDLFPRPDRPDATVRAFIDLEFSDGGSTPLVKSNETFILALLWDATRGD